MSHSAWLVAKQVGTLGWFGQTTEKVAWKKKHGLLKNLLLWQPDFFMNELVELHARFIRFGLVVKEYVFFKSNDGTQTSEWPVQIELYQPKKLQVQLTELVTLGPSENIFTDLFVGFYRCCEKCSDLWITQFSQC